MTALVTAHMLDSGRGPKLSQAFRMETATTAATCCHQSYMLCVLFTRSHKTDSSPLVQSMIFCGLVIVQLLNVPLRKLLWRPQHGTTQTV